MPWSNSFGSRIANLGAGTSFAQAVTSDAAAHTKGAWAEFGAIPFTSDGIYISSECQAQSSFLIDFGIGPNDSTVTTIAENIYIDSGKQQRCGMVSVFVPMHVPAGHNIYARCQSSAGGQTTRVNLHFISHGWGYPTMGSYVAAFGATTATTLGTNIIPGATAGTKGSYTQLTASTARDISAVALALGVNGQYTQSSNSFFMDLAVGAASSETVILPDFQGTVGSTLDKMLPEWSSFIPMYIPAGSRLSMRAAGPATSHIGFDVIAYGLYV